MQLMDLGFYQTNLLPSKLHDLCNTSQGESQCYYSSAYFTLCFGRLWWVMMVCGCVCMVHSSLCFVTGYDGWYHMYACVYMMRGLFCQTVTDDDGVYVCEDRAWCISVYVCTLLDMCWRAHIHQDSSLWLSGLVWASRGLVWRVMN